MPANPDTEGKLEAATMALFSQLGWETVNAYHETYGPSGTLGRETRSDVVLLSRLEAALSRLNPDLPPETHAQVVEELTRDRSAMSLAVANREVYALLKDGVRVTYRDPDGEERVETARLIDWRSPEKNDFLIVQQFWVTGEVYTRRADLVGFVNGIPLLFGELKAHHRRVEDAYRKNLADYKDTIPHLLWFNAFIVLSNGSDARIGTITSPWAYFSEWKKIDDEGETGVISLETAVRGTCEPARFLDIVENFVLYQESRGGLNKVVCMNHQYLGVNNAIDAVREIRENQGRLGVFWHTQGSGKSFSMVFFSQKVLRRVPGNWTFVIITDRIDLDDQIYKNFARCGAVIESENRVRAQSGEHLQQLLREDHRYVFTLIQKFGTKGGERYPLLSERDDIIVITDEAHRSQYDVLAMNMRDAMPNAAFLAFTATPLIVGEERTRQVFGDYVSVYSYKQSNEDGSTVPLYYENRIPEMELTNEHLNEDMDRLLEEAELDEDQEDALARQFAHEYHLITRDDRLERVAQDIAVHFVNRGYLGKGMVISIDKLTTVRMYDKVQRHWQRLLSEERRRLASAPDEERDAIQAKIDFMASTDMAVVLSSEQGEVAKFAEKGLDILPHRKRMNSEALDEKFKDPDDPFRLVFVCAMWRTGFDAPACSTIYLDRPMRNHTLMQTIARANRVFGQKNNGLIADYVGIFRDLQKALAIYGSGVAGGLQPGESPVAPKEELIEHLQKAIQDALAFCTERGVDLDPIVGSEGYQRIALMDDAVERIIVNDELKDQYLALAAQVDKLFKAILPDTRAGEFGPVRHVLVVLAEKIRSLAPEVDISGVMAQVDDLLDESVTARGYVIRETSRLYDLSKIDFDALHERFRHGRKRTELEKLRSLLTVKLRRMVRLNPNRMDFLEAFQRLIEEYNIGSRNVDEMYEALIQFAQSLDEEEQRAVSEGLSEEELALFDILTRPGPSLSASEKREVKRIARELLTTLKERKLTLDWRKRQQARASVQVAIQDFIWELPEDRYTDEMCGDKSAAVYQHVYDNYWGAGQSTYTTLSTGLAA
ncbi:MAG: type I restriction endonuclease subunit R [Anaerolineae bacterium]|nr:type I restriction endonuclease subunit R [Anaerolineae bacterium]